GRSEYQHLALNRGNELSEPGMAALTDELARRIDRHPVTIPLEARRTELHRGPCVSAGRLERIDEQALDLTLNDCHGADLLRASPQCRAPCPVREALHFAI